MQLIKKYFPDLSQDQYRSLEKLHGLYTYWNRRINVISRKDRWAVKKQGASRASKIYQKKQTAIKNAKKLRKTGHDVIVHKKDGSIQKWEKSKK